MNSTKLQDIYEQVPVSSERVLPGAPFPNTYIHCVVDDLQSAVKAVIALRIFGYAGNDVHVFASWDYEEAVERRDKQRYGLAKVFARLHALLDEGFGDAYLHEARKGRHILAVRLSRKEHMWDIRDLLARHNARLIKYVDAWATADLTSCYG